MSNISGALPPQAHTDNAPSSPGAAEPHSGEPESDEELLDRIQRAAFACFEETVNRANGLVADTTRQGSPCSIAVVGFALSCYPIAVEHGWMDRAEAVALTLAALRFFRNSTQNEGSDATGYRGFYYHFLDMESGRRTWQSELSLIDSALLAAGILAAQTYFGGRTRDEQEIRNTGDALYRRMDWRWALHGTETLAQGWKPESGFLHYGWEGYSEAIILYVLGLASPTYPLPADSYSVWTSTYQWENLYGHDVLYAGPLFIHQFSHAWIDFQGLRDDFMREKRSDYFQNSRAATLVQREYALRNPREYIGYGKNYWGFTACDGPGSQTLKIDGTDRAFFGYAARGVPYGPDDGTISPAAVLGSLPFAPEFVLPAVRHIFERHPQITSGCGVPGGVNLTLTSEDPPGWRSEGCFGLDQGLIVMMIENHRSQLIWKLMQKSPYIRMGLRRAGFSGGWLKPGLFGSDLFR
jgi:hypothetical protein